MHPTLPHAIAFVTHDPSSCPCPLCEDDRFALSLLRCDAPAEPATTPWASKRVAAQDVVQALLHRSPPPSPDEVRAAVRSVYGLPPIEGPRDEDAPADVDDNADLPPFEVRRSWMEATRDEPTAADLALAELELAAEVDEELRRPAFAWGACDLTDEDCCGAARIG